MKKDPVDYVILDDLLTPDVVEELLLWVKGLNLEDPDRTGSAQDSQGRAIKRNNGIFIYPGQGYLMDKIISIVCNSLAVASDGLKESPILYSFFRPSFTHPEVSTAKNSDKSHLLSVYSNGDHYETHCDASTMTSLFWLKDPDKDFTGGDLVFPDYDETVEFKHNRMIVFPGSIYHKVNPVSGSGRIVISTFFGSREYMPEPTLETTVGSKDGEEWIREESNAERMK